MRIRSSLFFRPSAIALAAVAMSFAAWIFPSFGILRKGYAAPTPIDLTSILVLLNWYVLLFLALWFGERVGGAMSAKSKLRYAAPRLDDITLLIIFSCLAAIGIAITYVKIFSTLSIVEAFLYITSGLGNELKESLYEEYSAGLVSLRYLVVFSAALAFARFSEKTQFDFLTFANVLLLVFAALLSSRLIFVATILSTIFLRSTQSKWMRVRVGRLSIMIGILFIILSVLNSSRNANYYESDGLYFWGAGLSSILTYLGSPFQVAIAAAQNLQAITVEGPEAYRRYADIDITLNTNSAFVQLHEELGLAAWFYLICGMGMVGLLFGFFRNLGKTAFLLPCAALLYGAAEFWRLDLFRQGIFIVWLFFGIAVPLLLIAVRALSRIPRQPLEFTIREE